MGNKSVILPIFANKSVMEWAKCSKYNQKMQLFRTPTKTLLGEGVL